jgi:hypothetical protein
MKVRKLCCAGPNSAERGQLNGSGLGRNPRAKRGWTALIPSRQKEVLRYFSGLKSAEAKARNLKQVLHVLSGGRARFMARLWNEPEPGGNG